MTGLAPSFRRVHALAWTGARQAVRDKVLTLLAGFGAVLIVLSVAVSQLTVGERGRIVMDLGLSAISLLTGLTAIVVTVNQASREIERRTIDTILAKPVARWEFLLGRFLGLAGTLALMSFVMGSVQSLVLLSLRAYDAALWRALLLGWMECLVIVAIALFFSTFTTSTPSLFITLGVVVIGHTSEGLAYMAERVDSSALRGLLHLIQVAVPNLELLNVRAQVVWGVPIPWTQVGLASLYALACCGTSIVLGAAILSRKDLA